MCAYSFKWKNDLVNLEQTNTIFLNLKGAFTCFILCDVILSFKICFDKISLGLLSVDILSLISLEALWRLASPSVTLGFSLQTRNKAFFIALRIFSKKKIYQSFAHTCTHKVLLSYAYNIWFFGFLLTFLKRFY